MKKVFTHWDYHHFSKLPNNAIPVLLYSLRDNNKGKIAAIGHPVIDPIKRLGIKLPPRVFDLLTIALAVTAADTFIKRDEAADRWTREIQLTIPTMEPEVWVSQISNLQEALNFLSGDLWNLEIIDNGYAPPEPYSSRYRLTDIHGLDCACLFSGGLDSAVGAINLLAENQKPLLVSHSYKGDKTHQAHIVKQLKGRYARFAANAYPISIDGKTEITMRTRSFNFIAFGAIAAISLAEKNKLDQVKLFVPENGFISLNAPLTSQRLGSLSTRTTHPYFIGLVQEIFNEVKIPVIIKNPYDGNTKGEMLYCCKNRDTLANISMHTVSCSNWKRKGKQCGRCVPCIIRRAALSKANIDDPDENYVFPDLKQVYKNEANRTDLFALMYAIHQLPKSSTDAWIADTGPLPYDAIHREKYKKVFIDGLEEVKSFFKTKGLYE